MRAARTTVPGEEAVLVEIADNGVADKQRGRDVAIVNKRELDKE